MPELPKAAEILRLRCGQSDGRILVFDTHVARETQV